jgi:WhiB family redox-sensing transcriptional regulator
MFPLITPEPWQEDALCAETDPEAFFPEKGGGGNNLAAARAVCAACTVAADCLDYAIRNGERFGVWGGLTDRQRRRIAHQLDLDSKTTTKQEPA